MKRFYSIFVLFATLVFVPGWVEVENEFTLNPDGSGKVRHHVLQPSAQKIMGGKLPSKQKQLKRAVKKEITNSKGIDAWEDVSYKVKDNGTLSFTGTAYFSDISELKLSNQRFNTIEKISRSEKSNENITFEMNPVDKQTPRSSNNTSPELTEEQVQKKIEKKRLQLQKMKQRLSQFGKMHISNIFNLPAPVQSSTNVELDSPKRARVFVSGKKLMKVMETVISSDEMLREWVKQGDGFKGPPPAIQERFNEILFGEKDPVQFTISGAGSPQFNYQKEVRQAKEETKKLKSKLGITSSVSNAGETSDTSGSGSSPDVDGGKYGVVLKNKETMKVNWGIAFFSQSPVESLTLVFYPKTPKKSLIKSIREEHSLFFGEYDPKKPFIEITFHLKGETTLSGDAVWGYTFIISNFPGRPTVLNRSGTSMMEKVMLKLDGSLEKGGRIKGIFKGSQDSDSQDHDNTYTWDLKFDLKIR